MSGRSLSRTRSYGGRRYRKPPGRGILRVPIEWTQIRREGDAEPRSRSYPAWFVQSTATSHRLFAARPGSGALVDIVIAAAAFGGSVVLLSHGAGGASRPAAELNLLSVLLAAGASLPLVAWRRAPFAVFVLAAAASVLADGLGYSFDIPLGPTFALYLLAASRDDASPWTRRTTVVTVGLLAAYPAAIAADGQAFPAIALSHSGLAWSVAWFAGERTRLRRQHVVELEQRAVRAERETDRERRLAAAEERARIARDLHDSAGHAISVIALRAGTARLCHDEDPARSRRALEAIEEVARQTAAEIEEIVGALRDGAAQRGVVEAPPSLASLDTLVERHTSTGLDVTVASAGTPQPLGRPVDQAAFRILQEALTNAARHGTGSAWIELAFGEAGLELTIANPVLAVAMVGSRSGHGIVGMRERATLLGGTFDAGRVNGAFRVHARLPYTGQRG